MNEYDLKVQICNLADSLVRNVNDNFLNVSFDILEGGFIQVKVILKEVTEIEEDYIEDISVEFTATQGKDLVERFKVVINTNDDIPLRYVVYNNLSS